MHLLVLLLVVGGVPKGGKLYIKGTGVSMTANADGTGAKTALKAGDEVTWGGPDEKNRSMHAVELRGKRGFVPMANLTPNRPGDEVAENGKTVSAAAFAASGKVGCTFGELRVASSPNADEAQKRLELVEASSEQALRRVDEHVKQQGLQEPK